MQKNRNLDYAVSGVTGHTIKMIAIATMFVDHFSYLIAPSQSPLEWILHFIGRSAAPIMCYLIAEGHHYTSDKKKYLTRLLLFAILSHIPYVLYFDIPLLRSTSVIWSLAMGLLALIGATNKHYSTPVKVGIVLTSCLLAYNANWNYIAVLCIVNFGLFRKGFKKQIMGFTLIGLIFYVGQGLIRIGPHVTYRIGIFLPILLFYFYNGKKGKGTALSKWSFYIFYPLHFMVLYLLKIFIFNGFA